MRNSGESAYRWFQSAIRSKQARRGLGNWPRTVGWSLILSQWRNPKTGKLEPNKFFPRIVSQGAQQQNGNNPFDSRTYVRAKKGKQTGKALACREIPGPAHAALGTSQ